MADRGGLVEALALKWAAPALGTAHAITARALNATESLALIMFALSFDALR